MRLQDAYIFVSGTKEFLNRRIAAALNNRKNIKSKSNALFTDCISEINSTQIDNVKDINTVMPIYNLIEYSDNY